MTGRISRLVNTTTEDPTWISDCSGLPIFLGRAGKEQSLFKLLAFGQLGRQRAGSPLFYHYDPRAQYLYPIRSSDLPASNFGETRSSSPVSGRANWPACCACISAWFVRRTLSALTSRRRRTLVSTGRTPSVKDAIQQTMISDKFHFRGRKSPKRPSNMPMKLPQRLDCSRSISSHCTDLGLEQDL